MKLNIGCGFNKLPGFINVDQDPLCQPDVVADLEKDLWPFESDSVDAIVANHALEHMGETPAAWFSLWKEMWRVCRDGANIEITVPHPRHDIFLIDPTHVRPIFPETIAMFDQMRNIRDFEHNGQETKLGLMCGIDLEVTNVEFDLQEPWKSAVQSGQLSSDDMQKEAKLFNNVCLQIRIQVRIIKPLRGQAWLDARNGATQRVPVAPSAQEMAAPEHPAIPW